MRKFLQALFFGVACFVSCAQVNASTLCSPPLPRDCVTPQWGVIGPDGEIALDGRGMAPLAQAADRRLDTRGTVRLIPVAMEAETTRGRGPRKAPQFILLTDDGRKLTRETTALVDAIKKATFDRSGRLVAGGERIARAGEVIRKVARDYVLSLYVRTGRPLKGEDAELLANKLKSIAGVLKDSDDYGTKGK